MNERAREIWMERLKSRCGRGQRIIIHPTVQLINVCLGILSKKDWEPKDASHDPIYGSQLTADAVFLYRRPPLTKNNHSTIFFFFLFLYGVYYIYFKKSSYASASAVNRQPSTTNTQKNLTPLIKKKKNSIDFFFQSLFKSLMARIISLVLWLSFHSTKVTSFNSKQYRFNDLKLRSSPLSLKNSEYIFYDRSAVSICGGGLNLK